MKSTWNLPPAPPGFQGLHTDKPVSVYVRHLPHWRQEGATYFVTFRLHDSLPQEKLRELRALRREWEERCRSGQDGRIGNPSYSGKQLEKLSRETMRRVERWLDQGLGACRLKDAAAARLVVDAMHFFDGQRYELGFCVVMPNHVHAIVRPFVVGRISNPSDANHGGSTNDDALERILQSWKRHTSLEINRLLSLTGALWQEESFDRIIRDEEHLYRTIQYIGANPTKAELTYQECPTWIRPEWVQLGWRFEP